MRTIPYSQLERGLAAIAGIDSQNLLAHEKAQFAEYINDATKFVWEHYPWPETTRVEKRYFRPLWVEGQNYKIGDEVFFNKKYYRKFSEYISDTNYTWGSAGFKNLYSFGNSYTDTGNYPDQFWQDREKVWVEYLSESLSLTSNPSSDEGTNFAVGGARLLNDYSDSVAEITVPSILSQINSAPVFGEDDLISFFGGGNDFLEGINNNATYISNGIKTCLEALIAKGAKNIVILNMFNLFRLPAVTDINAQQVSQDINVHLDQIKNDLESQNQGFSLHIVDFYSLIESTYNSLPQSSFDDIFYDSVHMKKGTHQAIASIAYDSIYQNSWSEVQRDWFPFVGPEESSVWHQTGDRFEVDDYREEGLYATGALVSFEEKVYLCIKTPTGDPTDPTSQFTNFSQNGIGLSNPSYWQEVDTTFDRYIGYDQEGQSVIGTLFSVHTDDPRYYSSTPLNWQLGREGVYINLPFETNEVWVKFREEPPTYSSGDSDKPVLNYLASAIKAYAYRSFLISDGQNEKAMLQEQMALDLLVKEIDKLVHQQDRGVKGFKAIAI